jgi:polar amino acid transport system substrate-binding protein
MNLSKRNLTLGLAAAALMAATGAQAQTALDDVMKAKKITIAIPTDFPPYGFVGTDLKPQGLDIDMANYIAAKLGVAIELAPVTSANRIPYLQTKKAELVISTLGKNPEREKVIDFTAAYSPFFQAVFAAKTLPIKSFADLAGKSIGVTRGAIRRPGADQAGPGRCGHQALRGQQRHRVGLCVGPDAADRHRRIGGRQHDGQEPAAGHRIQAAAEGQPQLHRRGQG